jgi:hypothetical protein
MKKLKLYLIAALAVSATGCSSVNDLSIAGSTLTSGYEFSDYEVRVSRISENAKFHYQLVNEKASFPCRPSNCDNNTDVRIDDESLHYIEDNHYSIQNRSEWIIHYKTNVSLDKNMLSITFSDVFVDITTSSPDGYEVFYRTTEISGKDHIDLEKFLKREADILKNSY